MFEANKNSMCSFLNPTIIKPIILNISNCTLYNNYVMQK